jgi:hypothetical protein
MIVQPYDYFLIVWFLLAGLSTAYVAVDQFTNNPEPSVMRCGFILATLYMAPLCCCSMRWGCAPYADSC